VFSQPPIIITNGYAGLPIYPLDSCYFFARTLAKDELFYRWDLRSASKTETLDGEFESTVWFRMTPFPLIATPSFRYIQQPITLQQFKIKGVNFEKKVFLAKAINPKGTVFLFHLETSAAVEWTQNNYEQFQLLKTLQYFNYNVVLFDCEERTITEDLNGDQQINWATSPHSLLDNIDYANCKIIIEELKSKGELSPNEQLYSIGNGNGGSFAQGFAELFGAKACVVYNSTQNPNIHPSVQSVPVLFNLTVKDNSTNSTIVQLYVDSVNQLSKCASIHYTRPTPFYPEMFSRTALIPLQLSIDLFDEIKQNSVLDSMNYLIDSYDYLFIDIISNPTKWPVARAINSSFSNTFNKQLKISAADREFNSNRVNTVVEFLEFPCTINTSVKTAENSPYKNNFETNPTDGTFTFESKDDSELSFLVYSINGVQISVPNSKIEKSSYQFQFSAYPKGLYFIRSSKGTVISILNQ